MPYRTATPPSPDPPMRRRWPCVCVIATLLPWLPIPWPWAVERVRGLRHRVDVRCRACGRVWRVEYDVLGVATITRVA